MKYRYRSHNSNKFNAICITLAKKSNLPNKTHQQKKKCLIHCTFGNIIINASALLGVIWWRSPLGEPLLHSMLLLLKVLSRIRLIHMARRRRRRHNRWRHLEGLRDTNASRQYVNSNLFPRYYYYYSAVTKLRKSKNYSVYSSLSLKFRKHFKLSRSLASPAVASRGTSLVLCDVWWRAPWWICHRVISRRVRHREATII